MPSERVAELPLVAPLESPWSAEDVASRLQVEVVDEHGAPLPDVVVAWFLSETSRPEFALGMGPETSDGAGLAFLDPEVLTRSLEKSRELGVDLRVRIGPHPGGAEAARVDVPLPIAPMATGRGVRLVLTAADRIDLGPLEVRVLDAAGRPLPDVQVELQGVAASRPGQPNGIATAFTDAADGVARIDLEDYHVQRSRSVLAGVVLSFRVVAKVGIRDAPSVDLGDAVRPGEVVELWLPPTATVVARVLHANGDPVDRPTRVMLWARESDAQKNQWFYRHTAMVDDDGLARFEALGLGLVLQLSPQVVDGRVAASWVDLPGPSRAGEVLEHELRLGRPWPWISFVAVDAEGRALADRELEFQVGHFDAASLKALGTSGGALRAHADAAGRVRLQLAGTLVDGYVRRAVVREREGDLVLREGRVDLSRDYGYEEENDLGQVVLHAFEPASSADSALASGTVLDPTGAPIASARVSARPLTGGGPGRAIQVEVGDDGTFELQGALAAQQLALAAWAPRHVSRTNEVVERGARDVAIVLEPAARFRARLLLDPGISRDLLEVHIQRGDVRRSPDLFGDRLEVDGFVPGAADVTVVGRHGNWTFASIEGLELRLDESAPLDPRIDPLDLRGALAMHTLRLVDPAGDPLRRVSVDLFDTDGSHGSAWTDPEGYLAFLAPRGVADLRVRPKNRAMVDVTWSADVETLTCPAGN